MQNKTPTNKCLIYNNITNAHIQSWQNQSMDIQRIASITEQPPANWWL